MKIYKDRAEDYVAVQASAAENGTISPSGRTLVRKGTSKTFSVTPNPGYEVASLVVDGVDLGPISYYTFEMVGVDHTVSATFKPAEGKTTYTVNAVATEGGSVTPSGVQTVPANGSVSFTAAPQSGFRFLSYRVNGRRVSEETAYTLENVDQNYYVEARFELIPRRPTCALSRTSSPNSSRPRAGSAPAAAKRGDAIATITSTRPRRPTSAQARPSRTSA